MYFATEEARLAHAAWLKGLKPGDRFCVDCSTSWRPAAYEMYLVRRVTDATLFATLLGAGENGPEVKFRRDDGWSFPRGKGTAEPITDLIRQKVERRNLTSEISYRMGLREFVDKWSLEDLRVVGALVKKYIEMEGENG